MSYPEPSKDEPGCGAVVAVLLLVGMVFWFSYCAKNWSCSVDDRLKAIEQKMEQKQ